MVNENHIYRTTNTPLAAYLLSEGYKLLEITYQEFDNSKVQGTFEFETTPKMLEAARLFELGKAEGNLLVYEHCKDSLLTRIRRRLP